MQHAKVVERFEEFLKGRNLKLTSQRRRLLDRVFATHEHFSAEQLYNWLRGEPGDPVSRATVYRTLSLLTEGGFLATLDAGRGELIYEHVLGHEHHDHILCLGCGRIEEFHDEVIEELQRRACEAKGFVLVSHDLRLRGYCKTCQRRQPASKAHDRTAT
ncbi:MAG: hypothetical protein RL277_1019 [Planctomycetota bacterium]